jgi:hypothetical protein
MTRRYIRLFIADINFIARLPVLLFCLLSPVLLTLVLFLFSKLITERYYSLAALTLIAVIPVVYGLIFSQIHLKSQNAVASFPVSESVNLLMGRAVFSGLTGFIVLVPMIFLTDPVPDEGWLRAIYASVLFAATAPIVHLISVSIENNRRLRPVLILTLAVLLISVPVGLLLHRPWNYLAFFSPFYWAVWAWVIESQAESLIYGIISLLISSGGIFLLFRYFTRRSNLI